MYCERCGNQLIEGQRFCSSCGKAVGIALVPHERQGKVQRNLQLLSVLWLLRGALGLIAVAVMFVIGRIIVLSGAGMRLAGASPAFPFLRMLFGVIWIVVGIHAVLGILAGWGLMQRAAWARPIALVAAFLELLHIPLGTALGVYTLWALLPSESGEEYEHLVQAA